ncbi:4-hydroxybenzoate octaprenyltransferase [Candidatus Pelagibacter sp.]|nr:4-hydroxybenzoate octaprenyltransferase [Candidatus Pelagibacter sp.]
MNQINLFIELTRLKKPIGYMLLFWPCAWGLTIAYDFTNEKVTYFVNIILFFFGAILMRSAGCIINDIADKKFDQKVFRTKNRPIASNKISIIQGYTFAITLCLIAFTILIQFNLFTIYLALISMPLAFTYPLMKRFTYWPQLFLGITFNYGLILGWTSTTNDLSMIPLVFYFGAIFWTLGYDTIYGLQDIKDDEIIGLKSTTIKFKKNLKLFLYICYGIFVFIYALMGLILKYNIIYFIIIIIVFFQMYYFQIYKLNLYDQSNQLNKFKSNNFNGLIMLIGLLLGKIS